MAIKAIETRYAGCRFRSRLEARWAVFFDALGIEWNYEQQGFETQHGWYLPDFWLPEAEAWIEVKGGKPTRRDQLKCEEVAREKWKSGHRFRILVGDIPRAPFSFPKRDLTLSCASPGRPSLKQQTRYPSWGSRLNWHPW